MNSVDKGHSKQFCHCNLLSDQSLAHMLIKDASNNIFMVKNCIQSYVVLIDCSIKE